MLDVLQSYNLDWQKRLRELRQFANSDHSILMVGPSGSGKDVLSRRVHELSSRANGPMVSVNCAAIHESLVESELFGHKKGSFTGAHSDRKGAFLSADKGTLFLDEIGDLSLSIQAKLLRILENRKIKSIGDDGERSVDVRIIAATHKPIEKLVKDGDFRMDLYYRLNVIQIKVPALSDRPEDIPNLLSYFAHKENIHFSSQAIEVLSHQNWEGNIRELRNFVMKSACLQTSGSISSEQVARLLLDQKVSVPKVSQAKMTRQLIKQIERSLLIESLVANNWNQRKTARELGMPKSTLHDQIKKLNIETLKEGLSGS